LDDRRTLTVTAGSDKTNAETGGSSMTVAFGGIEAVWIFFFAEPEVDLSNNHGPVASTSNIFLPIIPLAPSRCISKAY
jgi:hypothetical protein